MNALAFCSSYEQDWALVVHSSNSSVMWACAEFPFFLGPLSQINYLHLISCLSLPLEKHKLRHYSVNICWRNGWIHNSASSVFISQPEAADCSYKWQMMEANWYLLWKYSRKCMQVFWQQRGVTGPASGGGGVEKILEEVKELLTCLSLPNVTKPKVEVPAQICHLLTPI